MHFTPYKGIQHSTKQSRITYNGQSQPKLLSNKNQSKPIIFLSNHNLSNCQKSVRTPLNITYIQWEATLFSHLSLFWGLPGWKTPIQWLQDGSTFCTFQKDESFIFLVSSISPYSKVSNFDSLLAKPFNNFLTILIDVSLPDLDKPNFPQIFGQKFLIFGISPPSWLAPNSELSHTKCLRNLSSKKRFGGFLTLKSFFIVNFCKSEDIPD